MGKTNFKNSCQNIWNVTRKSLSLIYQLTKRADQQLRTYQIKGRKKMTNLEIAKMIIEKNAHTKTREVLGNGAVSVYELLQNGINCTNGYVNGMAPKKYLVEHTYRIVFRGNVSVIYFVRLSNIKD